jgi:hypothetical protein
MKTKKSVRWFGRGGGIKKCGPFESQLAAVKAMMTTEGFPIDDCFVWPELVTVEVHVRRECDRI